VKLSRTGAAVVSAVAAIGGGIGCGRERVTAPANAAREGVSIALYDPGAGGYGVIDDRRWVDVTNDALMLDRVDPRAALPSLVIEPLAGGALEIGACTRDRIPAAPVAAGAHVVAPVPAAFAPMLWCAVHGVRGRHLVRVLYVVPSFTYRTGHDVAMSASDRATVASRFAIATPAWRVRAAVTLFAGAPGAEPPPREIARGIVMLDGSIALIATPPRPVTAKLRRVYEGAVRTRGEIGAHDPRWRRDSQPAVWVWLELDGAALAPGPVHAHVELAGEAVRDVDVPAAGRRQAAAVVRLPLWIDDQLRGTRERRTRAPDDAALTDQLSLSVANVGDTTRDVWIEEPLRPARRRAVHRSWPSVPTVTGGVLRVRLRVPAGTVERAGFEVEYEL
jgi:hypothetical protein